MANKRNLSSLKRKADFHLIKIKGKRKTLAPWVMFTYITNPEGQFRLGLTISRKVGSAVTRNRLKRWSREFFREAVKNGEIPQVDLNIIFRAMEESFYKDLSHSEFAKTFKKGLQGLLVRS